MLAQSGALMNKTEVTKLITYIEENLRSSPNSVLQFVDSRSFQRRFSSKQNHVVFGRRGAGKTSLVTSTRDSSDHLDIYLNLEDFKDITYPNIIIKILTAMFTQINENIKTAYPWYKFSRVARRLRRKISTVSAPLQNYLHEPDTETQEISTKESSSLNLLAGAKSRGITGKVSAKQDKSFQMARTVTRGKLDYLLVELSTYKALLQEISALLSNKPILLILDDFYFIQKNTQPDLIDYFHRMTKATSLFLKIATIKHRSKLYRRSNSQYTGTEIGHDIFDIDIDYMLDDFKELQIFMNQLLENAIVESTANIRAADLFSENGFSQLCLASGGVPRDFLAIFVQVANIAVSNDQVIGKIQVTDAAIRNIGIKKDSMKRDSGHDDAILDEYLTGIKRFVFDEKKTNAFLIAKEDLTSDPQFSQAIRELVDLRLIHLVDDNISKAPSDGRRYAAYIIDIGLYDNSKPRNFTQREPGQRDAKARKDDLRASPVVTIVKILKPINKLASIQHKAISNQQSQIVVPDQLTLSFE